LEPTFQPVGPETDALLKQLDPGEIAKSLDPRNEEIRNSDPSGTSESYVNPMRWEKTHFLGPEKTPTVNNEKPTKTQRSSSTIQHPL
jgi:hypothetical protein